MDEEKFVRKDVFDARMDRIEAIMEKNLAKHEAIATKLEGKMETLSSRIDSLQHQRYWDIAWFAIAVTAVVAIVQYIKG